MVTVIEHRVSKQHSAFGLISDKLFGDLPLWLHQMPAELQGTPAVSKKQGFEQGSAKQSLEKTDVGETECLRVILIG
jgi:hypothetical protein